MKTLIRIYMAAALVVLAVSCSGYDDGPIRDRIEALDEKVAQQEELAAQLNSDILQVRQFFIAVRNGDTIVSCERLEDGTGYRIVFAEAGEIIVHDGKDTEDAGWKDGAAGKAPVVGVAADDEGRPYWTVDGQPLVDENGNLIYLTLELGVDGNVPQLRVSDGRWQLSYDGTGWIDLGESSVTDPYWFSDVEETSDAYVFTLRSGDKVTVARHPALSLVITGHEDLKLTENITSYVDYIVQGATSRTKVYAVSNCNLSVTVRAESVDKGQILFYPATNIMEGTVLVYADNGYGSTSMRMFSFTAGEPDIIDIEGYDKPADFDWELD